MKSSSTALLRAGCLASGLVAVSFLAGCSGATATVPNTAPVTGTVTYNGQPVEGASVTFVGEGDARTATALTGSGGTYELMTLDSKGALPGSYRVLVDKTEMPPELTRDISMEEAAANAGKPIPEPKKLLPAKYGDPTQTPLKFDVKEGSNTYDIELTDS